MDVLNPVTASFVLMTLACLILLVGVTMRARRKAADRIQDGVWLNLADYANLSDEARRLLHEAMEMAVKKADRR